MFQQQRTDPVSPLTVDRPARLGGHLADRWAYRRQLREWARLGRHSTITPVKSGSRQLDEKFAVSVEVNPRDRLSPVLGDDEFPLIILVGGAALTASNQPQGPNVVCIGISVPSVHHDLVRPLSAPHHAASLTSGSFS